MAAWIEEKTESKQDNPKTSSETKSVAYQTGILDENRKPNAKERKIRKPQRTPNQKNRNSLAQKPILKNMENPNDSLKMNRSVQSTNPTNGNKKTIIITETSTKTFCIVIFQSETCCIATLVTRCFSGKMSCHAIELFIDYEHRCL